MTDQPIRVLLVEDEEEDFICMRDLFAEIEHTVYALDRVATAHEAIRCFDARRDDVYLIDCHLGPASGLELLQLAQKMQVPMPVIMLAEPGASEVDLAAIRASGVSVLIKGEITAQSLERLVRQAIERKRADWEMEKRACFTRFNPNPVVEFTASGAMTHSNEAAEALARSIGEASLAPLLPPDIKQIVYESLRTRSARQFQTSRGTRSFAWSFEPIPENHVVHGYVIEITDRLKLEAQLRHPVKRRANVGTASGKK